MTINDQRELRGTQRIFSSPKELQASVSHRLGPTDWIQIDQARIDEFAAATCDRQWIHVDVERARKGPFRATVAHGYLTLSLVGQFLPQMVKVLGVERSINYGLDRVRFPIAVRAGAYVRASAELLAAANVKDGGVQATYRITIQERDEEKPACVADLIIRYLPDKEHQ